MAQWLYRRFIYAQNERWVISGFSMSKREFLDMNRNRHFFSVLFWFFTQRENEWFRLIRTTLDSWIWIECEYFSKFTHVSNISFNFSIKTLATVSLKATHLCRSFNVFEHIVMQLFWVVFYLLSVETSTFSHAQANNNRTTMYRCHIIAAKR